MHTRVRITAVLAVFLLAACAARQDQAGQMQTEQGAPYSLEVYNPMSHGMNVSYSMGGVVTVLGTVDAGATTRFQIPNRGGDEILVIATDTSNQMRIEKAVDLESDRTVRVTLSN